jgi:hypothetical protein
MKLKTKIEHTFDVDSNLLNDLDFTVDIPIESIKRKTKITEVKTQRRKKDGSTGLF